ncbi:aspartyl-phosphate phosphatase Spo0E family protein [Bacillus sp. FJAT-49711]|uniref:aspartyl-phosphate phosphatase Spo0E family protein n=1 Tax=Bacillus sp. FJAT-49711 TaxID=2833585 RepID=UPI0020163BC7|nr:aspartyl-phosphate phosphatase Spo0E family protein [Bacillus sp. FJAT-49711]
MTLVVDELEKEIAQLRIELIKTGKAFGLSSAETLYWSQKLDELILIYQKQLKYKTNNIDNTTALT